MDKKMDNNNEIIPFKLAPNALGYVESDSADMIIYWCTLMLTRLNGLSKFIEDNGRITSDALADFYGMNRFEKISREQQNSIADSFEALLYSLENKDKSTSKVLENNLCKIDELVGFNIVEKDIFRFVLYMNYYDVLEECGRFLKDITSDKLFHTLHVLLKHNKDSIKTALSPSGLLQRTGLLAIDRTYSKSLKNKFDLFSGEFAELMFTVESSEMAELFKDFIKPCSKGDISIEDFSHLKELLPLTINYLSEAVKSKFSGVNILLYGPAGSGKTELAKAIGVHLGVVLNEVAYESSDYDPISAERRLRAYRASQALLKNRQTFILFDEIEDVINDEDIFGRKSKQSYKAWFNRVLETNPIPTIWITNKVHAIDNALIRRFDMVVELPIPPIEKRLEIIQRFAGDLASKASIEKLAQHEAISPAIITRTSKVIERVKGSITNSSEALEIVVDSVIKAQGYDSLNKNDLSLQALELPKSYDPSHVNTSVDLINIATKLKDNSSARICLYGPSGTGKSAYAKWISKELNKPFLLKKGSDLISMFVGGTEANIAQAFQEATEKNAVLVFDEVDSFLQERSDARVSWEVTQVNEMLVQMENYNGVFVATTNLMDGMDKASLRRFDLKLEFGYLKPEHAFELFQKESQQMNLLGAISMKQKVMNLSSLTMGDFATIRRQNRFSPIASCEELYIRLVNEIEIKHLDSMNQIGFQKR